MKIKPISAINFSSVAILNTCDVVLIAAIVSPN